MYTWTIGPKGTLNGQQNTGFAVKRGLTVVRQPDFQALDVRGDGSLRYGARIDLTHNGQTLPADVGAPEERVFREPLRPTPPVRRCWRRCPSWRAGLIRRPRGRRRSSCSGTSTAGSIRPNDRVWADLDDGEPANADLTALTQEMPVSCRDNTFTEFIDHIVVDRRVLPWVDRSSFRQITYRQADKAVWDQLSDHCPVLVELWIR